MLTLRKATLADSNLILAWRNDPETIAMSTTQRGVTEAEHDRWYIKTLTDITVHLYVAVICLDGLSDAQIAQYKIGLEDIEANEIEIGMGRINEECGVAVLSYSIDKAYRGQGYGGELVADLCAKACELGCTSIQAVCRHANTASVRALLGQGFEIDDRELLHLTKEKDR